MTQPLVVNGLVLTMDAAGSSLHNGAVAVQDSTGIMTELVLRGSVESRICRSPRSSKLPWRCE